MTDVLQRLQSRTVTEVGERALALCWRPDGTYERYRSQWGGRERIRSAVLAAPPDQRLGILDAETWTPCGSESLPAVPDSLDYLSCESLYLCSPWTVGVALPLWFGLPSAVGKPDPTCGALVRVTSAAEATRLLETARTRKLVASDALTAGLIDESTALRALARTVADRTVGIGSRLAAAFDESRQT